MTAIISDAYYWVKPGTTTIEFSKLDQMVPQAMSRYHPIRFNIYFQSSPTISMPSIRDILSGKAIGGSTRDMMSCWAFVHCFLYGHKGEYRDRFLNFLKLQSENPQIDGVATFCDLMGKDCNTLEIILSWYIEKTVLAGETIVVPNDIGSILIVDADASTIGRIKGEGFRRALHPDLAKLEFSSAYRREKRENRDHDVGLMAAMGLLQLGEGENVLAEPLLQYAADRQIKSSDVYLSLYRLRKARIGDNPFSYDLTTYCMEPLIKAHKICPPNAGVYRSLAEACERTTAKVNDEILEIVIEGTRLFPADLKLLLLAAQAYAKKGTVGRAKEMATIGIARTTDAKLKAEFAALLGS